MTSDSPLVDRHWKHPSPDPGSCSQLGILLLRHGLVCVFPHWGSGDVGPPHHEHPWNPAGTGTWRVGHRDLRCPLRQRDHQPALAGPLVPQAHGPLWQFSWRCGGPALHSSVCLCEDRCWQQNAVLWINLSKAIADSESLWGGYLHSLLDLHGGHCTFCLQENPLQIQAMEGTVQAGGF